MRNNTRLAVVKLIMSNKKLFKDQHVMLLWPVDEEERVMDYPHVTEMTFIQEGISLQNKVCSAV